MKIEEFHEMYWSDKGEIINNHVFYYPIARERTRYYDYRDNLPFDPHYDFIRYGNDDKNGRQIEAIYDSVDFYKFNMKKFTLGDYTFYGFGRTVKNAEHYETKEFFKFGFYMDYHGLRHKIIEFEMDKCVIGEHIGRYHKKYEGMVSFFSLLKNPDIVLESYETKDVFGELNFNPKDSWRMIPGNGYPQKKHKSLEFFSQDDGNIDFEFFVMLEVENGIWKPSADIIRKLPIGNDNLIKPKRGKLLDLNINVVQLRNNAAFDISEYYNLKGVEVKASKSVLKNYESLFKYSKDEKKKKEVANEIKLEEEKELAEIKADTYTLMQDNKVVLKDVLSQDIIDYFENKTDTLFKIQAISAGRKAFEAAPKLDKLFFGHYGIYTYTECAGEKFAHFGDLESINERKGIKIPQRLVVLFNNGELNFPSYDKDDDSDCFSTGASFIGVAKDEDGEVYLIEEEGEQGI